MPEDATRRLLRTFGVSVTECEDALTALEGAARDPETARGEGAVAVLEAYGRAARELSACWTDVSRLIQDYEGRARQAEAQLRARSESSR